MALSSPHPLHSIDWLEFQQQSSNLMLRHQGSAPGSTASNVLAVDHSRIDRHKSTQILEILSFKASNAGEGTSFALVHCVTPPGIGAGVFAIGGNPPDSGLLDGFKQNAELNR